MNLAGNREGAVQAEGPWPFRTGAWFLVWLALMAGHPSGGQGVLRNGDIISPVAKFDAGKAIGEDDVSIHGFGVAKDFLIFLVCPVPNNEDCTAVLTDFDGRLFYCVPLGPGAVMSIAPADQGFAALVAPATGPVMNRLYSLTKSSFTDSVADADAAHIVRGADSLWQVSRDGRILKADAQNRQVRTSGPDHTRRSLTVMPFSDGQIGILDGVDVTLSVVDPANGVEHPVQLSHPEIDKAKASYADLKVPIGVAGVAVIAATVDNRDHMLTVLSGFRPKDGAPVLVFDQTGRFLRHIRLAIATRPDGKPIAPASVGTSDSQVFLVDGRGMVEVFSLIDIDP